ncbi:hypothetical protein AB0E88_25955 [Streptomyces sp. NPDC028635]|uniref:hypothetical protein n=1 Tax=Streptomyces sp. NPDC028635 TaxID=3154800 RepID=UPI0033E876BC
MTHQDQHAEFTRPDDTPRRACLGGRAAVLYKETVGSARLPAYRLVKRGDVNVALSRAGRAAR